MAFAAMLRRVGRSIGHDRIDVSAVARDQNRWRHQMAGHVKARGERRRTRSDWLQIEQARGISVSSSVMTHEYGVPVKLEPAPYETARWLSSDKPERLRLFCEANRFSIAEDKDSALAFLVRNAWTLDRAIEEWPDIEFLKVRERYGETQS
jgi:peptide chain release factor 3